MVVHLRFRRFLLGIALLAALSLSSLTGCGSGDDGGGDEALPRAVRTGRLALPAGATFAPTEVTIQAATGSVATGADGAFALETYADDPLFLLALSPAGNALFMGFVDADHAELNARTTAEALAYFGLGGFLVAEPADRQRLIGWLRKAGELDALTQAIADAVAADPEALADEDSPIADLVLATVQELLANEVSRAVLVQPGDARSGMRVNIVGANGIQLVNEYRRRAHVFIERVSYVPADGGAAVLSPAELTDFQVPPVTGLKSFAGTIVDLVLGNVAYAPVSSEVVSLPVEPENARKTTYKVSVVGAGANVAGDFPGMTAEQKLRGALTGAEQIVFDMFLPLLINVLAPNHEGTQVALEKLRLGGLKGSLIQGFTQGAPDMIRKLQAGDTLGAFQDAYNTFLTDATLRETIFGTLAASGLFVNVITGEWTMQANKTFLATGTALKLLKVLDAVLQGFDTLTMGVQLGLSNLGDAWTVDVTQPRVRLTPETAAVAPGEQQELTVAVPELTDDGLQVVYQWSTEGNFGTLTDGQGGHTNTFESTKNKVTYTAKGDAIGTDIVQVEAFQLIVGDGPSQKISVGTASATLNVAHQAAITLSPPSTTIKEGESAVFTAGVDPLPENGTLEYNWRSTTAAGDLVPPAPARAEFVSSSNTATYRANDGAAGEDTITVTVVHVVGEGKTILGTANATVNVTEQLPTQRTEARLLWKGFTPYEQPGLEHLWRWGMIAVFAWDKVPGEDFYDLKLVEPSGPGWSFGDMPGWGPQSTNAHYKYHTAAELRALYPDRGLALDDNELYYLFAWAPLGGVTQDVDTSEYEARMAEALKVVWEVTVTR